ncbi:unnamed protein product [Penicillium salamii]|uniref:Cytochrome P450 n=1 Tax=Penicillium salamii TaxID=1612424 RepID=A0A9W4NH89_9EURO|nr:unnamed protein product [Penicillium salamii]CAG8070341.1 unnamed protein product [Penicillium salamii]CAG8169933.1 unnamed protein product [Penicillium salamii]CAG8231110.1 unnamed protein product [Penicillium salamii]CAG8247054.1 unnamed protein product [Penicillium salamii]
MTPILCLLSGISSHLIIYRHGDWDTKSPVIVLAHILALAIGTIGSKLYSSSIDAWEDSLIGTSSGLAYHLIGVYGSMLVYRTFFHRLVKVPGPFLARMSNLFVTVLAMKRLQLHEELHSLHSRYGDYVRIGPRELSITDPAAVPAIYGSRSDTKKGPWYTLLDPRTPMSFTRDKEEHARRRKTWDKSFSTKALASYEPLIAKCARQLTDAIDERLDAPIEMSKWFRFYVFEIMASLAFGRPFNMLTEQTGSYFLRLMRQDMELVGYLRHLPWLSFLLIRVPGLNWRNAQFWKWIESQFSERIQNGPQHPDIFSSVLNAYLRGPKSTSDTLRLHGDGYLIVIAGSDTTTSTITHLMYHLACSQTMFTKLQKELDKLPELSDRHLMSVELLDAIIFETLRLHPATPAGVPRVTSSNGLTIDGTYIPPDTVVTVPLFTLFRDERSFRRPTEFIPERWTTSPELVKDRSVFIPFLIGVNACIGKRLAMMKIRRVVAELLIRYNISLAPDQTEKKFIEGKVDTFALSAAALSLEFRMRETEGGN